MVVAAGWEHFAGFLYFIDIFANNRVADFQEHSQIQLI